MTYKVSKTSQSLNTMLKTIEKLGYLADKIEDFCGDIEVDVHEAAFIANMFGGVDNAMCHFECGAYMFVSKNCNATSFENVNEIFDFFADEIVNLRFLYEERNIGILRNKKIYDCEREKDKLIKQMLFEFNGDESSIMKIVEKYCNIYFDSESLDYLSSINVSYHAGNYRNKRFVIVCLER